MKQTMAFQQCPPRLAVLALAAALAGCASAPSDSGTATSAPTAVATTTTLVATPNPATAGAAVTLTATVAGGSQPAYGTVTFYDGTATLGSPVTPVAAVAILSVTTFAAGSTHTLKAVFNGDVAHATSISASTVLSVSAVAAPASIGVHAAFSFASPNQTIAGFGAAEAFDTNYLTSHPYRAEIYKALFDPTAGLGLSFLRVQNNYRGVATGFDTDTPTIVAAANAANGSPLTLLMSSWSPSADLKSNGVGEWLHGDDERELQLWHWDAGAGEWRVQLSGVRAVLVRLAGGVYRAGGDAGLYFDSE
jgi:hypothetical protein